MRRQAVAVLALLVVLAGCTSTPPSPGPSASPEPASPTAAVPSPVARTGAYVGVVLEPPGDAPRAAGTAGTARHPLAVALEAAAERLPDMADLGVERVRVLEPPSESFRADEMAFLAQDGADVVCTSGNAAEVVAEIAPRYPGTAFCLLDAVLRPAPDNAASVGWDDDGIAFLTGAAAALVAGADGVALVAVGDEAIATVERRRAAFDAGARHVRPGVRVRPLAVTPDETEDAREATRRAAAALLAGDGSRARAVTVLGDLDALSGAAEAAASAGGVVVGWDADLARLLDEDLSDTVALSVVKRVDIALVTAISRVRESVSEPLVFGPGDDALAVVDGPAGPSRAVTRIRRLAEDVAEGSVSVPPPPRGPAG